MAHIEALFPTADDALSASIRLRTIDGVKEIRTERRSDESDTDQNLFLAGALGTNTDNVTTATYPAGGIMPGPVGAMAFADLVNGDGEPSSNHDVVLTCVVEENRMQEVIDAIIRAGGSVVAQ